MLLTRYCYFKRDQSEDVKQLIGDIAPKPVAESSGPVPIPMQVDEQEDAKSKKKIDVSAWNYAGTFEERDMSGWSRDRLKELCLQVRVTNGGLDESDPTALLNAFKSVDLTAISPENTSGAENLAALSARLARVQGNVTKAKKVEGDAHIAVVRGTKRYLFDFSIDLEFEVIVEDPVGAQEGEDAKPRKFSGTLCFHELSNTTQESEWEFDVTWKKRPKSVFAPRVTEVVNRLKHEVFQQVQTFALEYAQM
jgi:hypothetical protein